MWLERFRGNQKEDEQRPLIIFPRWKESHAHAPILFGSYVPSPPPLVEPKFPYLSLALWPAVTAECSSYWACSIPQKWTDGTKSMWMWLNLRIGTDVLWRYLITQPLENPRPLKASSLSSQASNPDITFTKFLNYKLLIKTVLNNKVPKSRIIFSGITGCHTIKTW